MSSDEQGSKSKKKSFYFTSMTDFVNSSRRMVVFHEENVKDKKEEVYYLVMPKENLAPNLYMAFKQLSLESYPAINYLSPSSQKNILEHIKNDEAYFIYLDKLVKKHPDDAYETSREFKMGMPEFLLELYPELKTRVKAEGYIFEKNNENKDDSSVSPEQEKLDNKNDDLIDYVVQNHKEISKNIKNEAVENFNVAKKLLMKNAEKVAPDLKIATNELKEGAGNLSKSLTKQVGIIKKMKK